MVTPVDGRGAFDACGSKTRARIGKIRGRHLERMMTAAERMTDYLLARGGIQRRPRHLEQRQVLTAAIEQNLIAETIDDPKPENAGVKTFGPREVRHLDPKVIQPLKSHSEHRIRDYPRR